MPWLWKRNVFLTNTPYGPKCPNRPDLCGPTMVVSSFFKGLLCLCIHVLAINATCFENWPEKSNRSLISLNCSCVPEQFVYWHVAIRSSFACSLLLQSQKKKEFKWLMKHGCCPWILIGISLKPGRVKSVSCSLLGRSPQGAICLSTVSRWPLSILGL